MSRGWAKASACCLQTTLSCAFLCHIVSLQYLSRSSLHRLAGLPCRLFLSYGLQLVTREVHRSSLRRLICPAQDHFIFLTVLIISIVVYNGYSSDEMSIAAQEKSIGPNTAHSRANIEGVVYCTTVYIFTHCMGYFNFP